MDTILGYLESMFATLPDSPELLRAKRELGQMMEDKYSELIAKGASENEAIGTVISEFGNLDEVAQTLGIEDAIKSPSPTEPTKRVLGSDEAKAYLDDCGRAQLLRGLGTLLFILCASGVVLYPALGGLYPLDRRAALVAALVFLFACVAAAVALFLVAARIMDSWSQLDAGSCSIDPAAVEYVRGVREEASSRNTTLRIIGALCCAVCYLPLIVASLVFGSSGVGVVALLVILGLGVQLLMVAEGRERSYQSLLLIDKGPAGTQRLVARREFPRSDSRFVQDILALFWPTVTCIYLIWSFLTFRWYISWIIWPIAALIERVVRMVLRSTSSSKTREKDREVGGASS